MKNHFHKLGLAVFMFFSFLTVNEISAQNINISYVLGAAYKLSDVRVSNRLDLNAIEVDDVSNDMPDVQKYLLNEVLNKAQSDNVLKRLLRKAKRINSDKMVVGVITTVSGDIDQILVAERKYLR